MKKSLLAGLVLVLGCGIACENAKRKTAEAAVHLADEAWRSLGPDAKSLAPDQLKSVQDSITAAHDALNKQDYDAALAAAKDLPGQVKDLRAAVQAKKDELTVRWRGLSDTVPGLLSAVQTRVDKLNNSHHHLPAGVTAELAAATQTWGEASSAFNSGQLFEALTKGSEARSKLEDLQKKLHMKQG